MLGMDRNTDKGTFYRALAEGTAMELKVNIDTLAKGGVKTQRPPRDWRRHWLRSPHAD